MTTDTRQQTPVEEVCTDLANVTRLREICGNDFRYVRERRTWYTWTGARWAPDHDGSLRRRARIIAQHVFDEAIEVTDGPERRALLRHAQHTASLRGINAMLELLASEDGLTWQQADTDTAPMLVACRNGVIDLETGELREAKRRDRLTRMVNIAFDPEAECPRWAQFLAEILPDAETVDFVHRAAGYSLTGHTSEQCLFLLHGHGANGKSVLLETLLDLFGDLGMATSADTLLAKGTDATSYDLASLHGARLVVANETEHGRRLAEARVKALTSGDTISAREPYGKPFTFRPVAKVWLATNHRPAVSQGHAIWRRLRLVPFERKFTGDRCDPQLRDKLKAELPGILAWCVRGAALWHADGLKAPQAVAAATRGYMTEQDWLGDFLDEVCNVNPGLSVSSRKLYAAFVRWCDQAGERVQSQRALAMQLKERGFEQGRSESARYWSGLAIRGDDA